jgi:hypothetical protein
MLGVGHGGQPLIGPPWPAGASPAVTVVAVPSTLTVSVAPCSMSLEEKTTEAKSF